MKSNLIIGKNSFVGRSLSQTLNGRYVSYKDINDLNFKKYQNIFLLSSSNIYKKKKIINFSFEEKILTKLSSQKLIFFSTSKIYPNKLNCSEKTDPNPQNFYAENKLKLEKIFNKEYQKLLILRVSNIFDVGNFNKNTFLGIMHENFFKNDKIFFDISINSVRDFISMKSIKKIINKIEKHSLTGTFNVGSQEGYKIKDIINFYFGKKLISLTKIKDKNKIKSQTLSIKKIEKLIDISKYDFHNNTKIELKKCKKFFF